MQCQQIVLKWRRPSYRSYRTFHVLSPKFSSDSEAATGTVDECYGWMLCVYWSDRCGSATVAAAAAADFRRCRASSRRRRWCYICAVVSSRQIVSRDSQWPASFAWRLPCKLWVGSYMYPDLYARIRKHSCIEQNGQTHYMRYTRSSIGRERDVDCEDAFVNCVMCVRLGYCQRCRRKFWSTGAHLKNNKHRNPLWLVYTSARYYTEANEKSSIIFLKSVYG